jgi:hypothetical protein
MSTFDLADGLSASQMRKRFAPMTERLRQLHSKFMLLCCIGQCSHKAESDYLIEIQVI